MKNRVFAVLLMICFCFCGTAAVYAEPEATEFTPDYPPDADLWIETVPTESDTPDIMLFAADPAEAFVSSRTMPLLVDRADLLNAEQEQQVENVLEQYSNEVLADIVIVTVSSTDGAEMQDYADDFYDYNHYGFGEAHDGLLFLLSMDTRDWWISTTGSAEAYLFDSDIQALFDSVSEYLASDNYYEAFCVFGANASAMLRVQPLDGDNGVIDSNGGVRSKAPAARRLFSVKRLFTALAFGFVVAFLIMKGVAGSLKSVSKIQNAESYVCDGSLKVHNGYDNFLYANVARTARPKSDTPARSGGAHSVHVGSSGTSHGGGGGHF